MSHVHALSALAGLTLVAAGLGGMMVWQSSSDAEVRAAAEARGEWRPSCAARLGPAYAAVAPTVQEDPGPPRTLLFGVDRSPSNLELSDEQMDAVTAYAATTPADTGVGVLLISDRSERSSTPDMPFEAGAPRRSFVVAMKDIAELWEISYDPKAEPIYDGMVHDYKLGEGVSKPGFLGVRRTLLDEPLDDFFFDPAYRFVLGATRPKAASLEGPKAAASDGPKAEGAGSAQVVGLDIRRRVATLPIAGMPHLGSGISFAYRGVTVLASPNLKDGAIDVIDLQNWKPVATIATPGPGFFMRSHEATPYAWTDSMMSPTAKDTLTIIDKRTLQPVASVREPGKTLAHIEFTKDGRYALASLWENDGALIVYDAQTFKEVKRLPMSKPVGKYNVWNKITRSEGTSH